MYKNAPAELPMRLADNASVPTRSSNAKLGRAYLTSCPSKDSLTQELQYRCGFKSLGVRDWMSLGDYFWKISMHYETSENTRPTTFSRAPQVTWIFNDNAVRRPNFSNFKRSAQFWLPIQTQKATLKIKVPTIVPGEKCGPTFKDRLSEYLGWRGMLLISHILPHLHSTFDCMHLHTVAYQQLMRSSNIWQSSISRGEKRVKNRIYIREEIKGDIRVHSMIARFHLLPRKTPKSFAKLCTQTTPSGKILYAYLLTPSKRVLLEKLVLQLIKKFPAFYGTPKFITVLTSARHLSLSWANPIESPQPLPISWRSILILSSHLRM
jgi:hypothetical protein